MEKAILVGLDLGNDIYFEETMEELANLAVACNIEVCDKLIQKRDSPTSNFYIGEGKVDELKDVLVLYDANVVIFNDELSPSHIRNLEQKLETKVIDRTVLILDIFARRAKTKEAMLQVELAQSQYMLPRVVGMYSSLSRQKSGTGSKGPGEQQLELDKRVLRDKITKLKRELKELVKIRRTQRDKRTNSIIKTVALTGYTNSGKSSLMNAIIDHTINPDKPYAFSQNMLFATLETRTRKVSLENNNDFLLTDTVGFIRKLANPNYEHQIETVETVLSELGVKDIPIIYVFNKIDLLEDIPVITRKNSILISAKNNINIDNLISIIDKELYKTHKVEMLIPFNDSSVYSEMKENCLIIETEYLEDGIHITAEINDYYYHKYKKYLN